MGGDNRLISPPPKQTRNHNSMIQVQHAAERHTWTAPTSNTGIDWDPERVQTQTERSNEIKHHFLTSSKPSPSPGPAAFSFFLFFFFFFRGRKQCSVTSHAHSTSLMTKTQLTAEPATHGTAPRSHRARGEKSARSGYTLPIDGLFQTHLDRLTNTQWELYFGLSSPGP